MINRECQVKIILEKRTQVILHPVPPPVGNRQLYVQVHTQLVCPHLRLSQSFLLMITLSYDHSLVKKSNNNTCNEGKIVLDILPIGFNCI